MAPKKSYKKGEPKVPITSDPRFSSVHNDPRFLRPKKKDMKVTIDKRFAGMMNSTEFSDAPRVDKYGRRLQQGTAEKELKRFYQLEEEQEEEDSDQEKSLTELEKELAEDEENLLDEESQYEESDDEVEEESKVSSKVGFDPMRGRGEISSSDEDTDDSDAEVESDEEEVDEIDAIKHISEGEETSRLALVNMDWDKIKAVDILKVLSGFKPDTGVVKSVAIYPSEFGKERIALEDTQGPPKEIFKDSKKGDASDDDEEVTAESVIKNQVEEGAGLDFDQEALRKYQLDRLKYYYAVIECDSPQTAKVIYKTCDNTEYESSANFFDLRYIPEDMTFDDQPKEVATEAPEGYTPTKFKTDALQRTKVSLTWDEDDVDRLTVTRRDFTQDDIKQLDFDAYLASSDEDEDEDEDVDALREKYRKLLNSAGKSSAYEDNGPEDDEDGDMEITFTPGLSEVVGAAVKNKDVEEKEETTIEAYIRKQKEKRKAKKTAKHTEKSDNDEEEDDSEVDAETENDPFFKEAMEEMADEGFVAKKKAADKKKSTKKRASKEERDEKARERAELELLMDDDGKGDGFNMKEVLKREKLEKKGKKAKKAKDEMGEDNFEIDVADPRFSAVQESHHFAIDPTNPHYKKTKNMQKLLNARQEKMKESTVAVNDEWKKEKKQKTSNTTNDGDDSSKPKSSLSQLVASVKRKSGLDKNTSGKRQKK